MTRPGTGRRAQGTAPPPTPREHEAGAPVGVRSPEAAARGLALDRQVAVPGTRSPEPISIVGVRFLNARPLLAGLEAGLQAPFAYHFATAEPSECADRLGAGGATAGLVPAAALPFLPGVRALPTLGVAARQEVRSVLLISRVPLEDVRTLAAHAASRSSVALARLLLAERWGVRPQVVEARPPLERMLVGADAAVLIGDPALHVQGRTGLDEIDLAAAWVEWTGLPFVFAVWGVRSTAPAGVDALLEGSLAYAREHWQDLLPRWAEGHGVEREETRQYLEETLTYTFGETEREGLEEFLRRAAAAGVLPSRREVWRAA
jgi:predicted solute-binding protein